MARAKKVDDSVEAVAAPVVEKKPRTRKKVEETVETVVETVEVKAAEETKEEPAPVEEKVEETVQEEQVEEVVTEVTQEAPVEVKDEVIEVTSTEITQSADDEESVVPEGFRPVLRPTSVAGQPLGYIGCPKQVFDIVTRKGWRKGIEKHKYRTQLMSILYWYRKNGSASVRCNSSSKFAEVSH